LILRSAAREQWEPDIEILLEVGTIAIASFVVTRQRLDTKASLPAAACRRQLASV
jgi:hypothetical protein